jgi:hypothetical protein
MKPITEPARNPFYEPDGAINPKGRPLPSGVEYAQVR